MTLKEKNVPYEYVEIDFMNGEHKREEYLKKQPFGMLPYVEDDGFVLYESRAIARYIETKFKGQGTELIPTDLKALALFEQGASIETSYFDLAGAIIFERLFKSINGLGESDEDIVKPLLEKLTATLDVYDKILSKQEYIGGNTFTLVDIFHLPYATYLHNEKVGLGSLIHDRPHVKAWWEKISSRQTWKDVVAGKV